MWKTDERNIHMTKMITTVLMAGTIGLAIFGAPAAMAESSKYGSCKEAAQDGRYNIPKDDPDYDPKLDRDGDGIACEKQS